MSISLPDSPLTFLSALHLIKSHSHDRDFNSSLLPSSESLSQDLHLSPTSYNHLLTSTFDQLHKCNILPFVEQNGGRERCWAEFTAGRWENIARTKQRVRLSPRSQARGRRGSMRASQPVRDDSDKLKTGPSAGQLSYYKRGRGRGRPASKAGVGTRGRGGGRGRGRGRGRSRGRRGRMRGADITRPLPTDVEGREEDADTETSGDENLRKGSEGKVIGFTPGDVRPLEVDEGEYGEEEAEEDKGSLGGDGMDVYVDGMNVDMDEEAGTPSNEELAKLAQTVLQRHEMNPTYSFSDDEMDERWRSRSLSREL